MNLTSEQKKRLHTINVFGQVASFDTKEIDNELERLNLVTSDKHGVRITKLGIKVNNK